MPAAAGSLEDGLPSPLWVAAMRDAFSDVEWVDSALDLGDGRKIDWIGIDPSGRIVFVLHCDGDGEAAVLAALDAWVFFERNRTVLGEHLRSTRVRPALAPILALIADSFSEQMLARLCGLSASGLRLLELRQLSSARGERAYLVAVSPSFGRSSPSAARGPEAFLSALPEGQRSLGELLIRRIGRIDDQLFVSAGDRSLSWRLGDEPVCSITQIDGVIEGQIAPEGDPRAIVDASQVEIFVDHVLGRYVAMLGGAPMAASSDPAMFAALEAGMTLTPEEIAAFRQSG